MKSREKTGCETVGRAEFQRQASLRTAHERRHPKRAVSFVCHPLGVWRWVGFFFPLYFFYFLHCQKWTYISLRLWGEKTSKEWMCAIQHSQGMVTLRKRGSYPLHPPAPWASERLWPVIADGKRTSYYGRKWCHCLQGSKAGNWVLTQSKSLTKSRRHWWGASGETRDPNTFWMILEFQSSRHQRRFSGRII